MSKTNSSSWLPKGKTSRSAVSGRYATVAAAGKSAPTQHKGAAGSGIKEASAPRTGKGGGHSREIRLPNGDVITSVRGDVMDRALGRGDFKKG